MTGTHATEVMKRIGTEPDLQPFVADHSPAALMTQALAAGQDLGQLEKLMDLQIRYEENEAKKAYHKAMAAFKANPPEIEKDKQVGYTSKKTGYTTAYAHASLHNVADKINKAMSPHGLNPTWNTEQGENGLITVTCTITHELGHSESTSLSAGADNSGQKNSIQAIGSTISYLERYTILALTGLATKDMDDDGNAAGKQIEYVDGDRLERVKALVKETGANVDLFLKAAKAESIDKIPLENYANLLNLLNTKKAKAQENTSPNEAA